MPGHSAKHRLNPRSQRLEHGILLNLQLTLFSSRGTLISSVWRITAVKFLDLDWKLDYKLPPGRWSSFNQWGQMLLSQRNNCWTSETKFISQAGFFGVVWTPIDIFSLSSCLGNMSTTKGICQSSAQEKAHLAASGIIGINSLPKNKTKQK